MKTAFGKFGFGDVIIIILIAWCITFCLFLTFAESADPPVYDNARWGSEEAWYHFLECQTLCDHYQVDLKMWSWQRKVIRIHIPDNHWFTTGTDGACEAFGIFAKKLLDIYADGWLLYATGSFVPSAKMPIDLEWAQELAKGY